MTVTPEMIEAGVDAYRLFDRGDPAEWMVSAVYVAMVGAKAQPEPEFWEIDRRTDGMAPRPK
jgi:hypothetical protein